ncbi:hypothetical protein (plasmid) [Metabacillus dongyingensis]|nr:hypothetical protein [Metabacillus dongyingensis]
MENKKAWKLGTQHASNLFIWRMIDALGIQLEIDKRGFNRPPSYGMQTKTGTGSYTA